MCCQLSIIYYVFFLKTRFKFQIFVIFQFQVFQYIPLFQFLGLILQIQRRSRRDRIRLSLPRKSKIFRLFQICQRWRIEQRNWVNEFEWIAWTSNRFVGFHGNFGIVFKNVEGVCEKTRKLHVYHFCLCWPWRELQFIHYVIKKKIKIKTKQNKKFPPATWLFQDDQNSRKQTKKYPDMSRHVETCPDLSISTFFATIYTWRNRRRICLIALNIFWWCLTISRWPTNYFSFGYRTKY